MLWIVVSAGGGILFLVGLARFARGLRPQPGLGDLPMTPLERLGWTGVGVAGLLVAGIGILVATFGVAGFHDVPAARLAFWLMLMAGIGIWAGSWMLLRRRYGATVVDERDRAILARSFQVESMVVLVSLVAWTVALTETFWETQCVPLAWVQLLFWTTFVGGALGRSVGIVLGYRREIDADA